MNLSNFASFRTAATVSMRGANAVPLSEVVSKVTSNCPDIANALNSPDFSTLNALIATAGDAEIST